MTKESLLQELSDLLKSELNAHSFMPREPHPEHGNLPLEMPYVRVEPWLFGFQEIRQDGAWQLCVETAKQWSRTPVLAYKNDTEAKSEEWRFRVPLYLIDVGFEGHPDNWHDCDRTASLFIDEFAGFLFEYQSLRGTRADWVDLVKTTVGVDE